jgi:hypothetical protein
MNPTELRDWLLPMIRNYGEQSENQVTSWTEEGWGLMYLTPQSVWGKDTQGEESMIARAFPKELDYAIMVWRDDVLLLNLQWDDRQTKVIKFQNTGWESDIGMLRPN